jgi:membrane protease YdiL (CAAX protease family)
MNKAIASVREVLDTHRNAIVIFFTAVFIILFMFFGKTQENLELVRHLPILRRLPGDYPQYVLYFTLSLFFLGFFPYITAVLSGKQLYEIGLARPRPLFERKITYTLVVAVIIVFGVSNAYNNEIYDYYPLSESLIHSIEEHGFHYFAMHTFIYLFMFYLPWELTFRGLLVFPFIYQFCSEEELAADKWQLNPKIITIAVIQTVPSSLLHFGHPVLESLGAIAFGFFMAYVVVKTRSIFWSLAMHAGIGISLDLIIIFRQLQYIP